MKRTKIYLLVISSLLFGEYLQEGAYPECSYIIVTEDGWRVHKNYEGRVLSMKAPKTHNDKIGKYSFDEYGNLVEFSQCTTEEILSKKIENDASVNTNAAKKIKFVFDLGPMVKNVKSMISKSTLSVNGGLTKPVSLYDFYTLGYHYGLDINFNKLSMSLLGINVANNNNGPSLTGNGFTLNYDLKWKNFYFSPGFGMLMTEGENLDSSTSGTDNIIKTDIGMYVNKAKKISLYGTGILSLTTIGEGGKAAYINMGIKYNF